MQFVSNANVYKAAVRNYRVWGGCVGKCTSRAHFTKKSDVQKWRLETSRRSAGASPGPPKYLNYGQHTVTIIHVLRASGGWA